MSATTETCLYSYNIRGGSSFAWQLKRGYRLRFTDIEGGGNLACMIHHADNYLERYNMPDTLKGQHTSHLTYGHCLHSDMGHILASIVADDLGWHDPIGGFSNISEVHRKYGKKSYQEAGNNWHRASFDHFAVELGKFGLGIADMTASLNLFSKVQVSDDGGMHFIDNHSPAGSSVTLRADMPLLITMSALQHPMDPQPSYAPKPILMEVFAGQPADSDDPCRTSYPENDRAMTNTELLFL